MDILKEKTNQAVEILKEVGVDCWMTFVRETPMMADPVMPLLIGLPVVWQSFFIYTRNGDAIALVGNFDAEDFRRSGRFTEVIPYTEGVGEDIRKMLARLDPKTIAINYAKDDPSCDGLSHGMYLKLLDYLKGTAYADRLVSAYDVIQRLRSRKTPEEAGRLRKAAIAAHEVWEEALTQIKRGMTEKQIADLMAEAMRRRGLAPSFPTIVNAGTKTQPGHSLPTEAVLEPGDLLHVDFGVIVDNYCSDIQRLAYVLRDDEKSPPEELIEAFELVRDIITATAQKAIPGVKGYEIDEVARTMLTEQGYPEYQHALGHQLGRSVHDGGGTIGPNWERYGMTTSVPMDTGNVYTLELEINVGGIGCAGLEEDVIITEKGAEFLGPRQTELPTI